MAKILVIGASGFIGKHLVPKLQNHNVTWFVRASSDISHIKNGKFFKGDITDLNDLISAGRDREIIINLATPNTQNPKINRAVIVEGAKNLVKAAQKNSIQKIIHLSSAAGYRKNLDSYGKSKKEADVVFYNSGIATVILKPTMVYGRGGYAFDKMLQSIRKIPLLVPMAGNGKYKIQPVYVEDVVEVIRKSVDLDPKGVEVYDLAGPRPIEYRIFLKKILQLLKRKKMLLPLPVFVLSGLVRFLNIFFKNLPANKNTILRMIEEIEMDTTRTERAFKMQFTDYDEALERLFS